MKFCVVVGQDEVAEKASLIERWDGTAWSLVPSPPTARDNDAGLAGVSCTGANFCMAVGQTSRAALSPGASSRIGYIDHWDGTTWLPEEAKNEEGHYGLRAVSCTSPKFCMAVGDHTDRLHLDQFALANMWDGKNWSIAATPVIPELQGVSCVTSTFCMAVGPGEVTAVWNGTAWSEVPTPKWGDLKGVSCVSVSRCVAVGRTEGGALVEEWNGTTWSIIEAPSPAGAVLTGVSCVPKHSCVAVGLDATPGGTHTLIESSKGGKWSIVPSANGASGKSELEGVSCVAKKSCFAVGADEATSKGPLQTLIESGRP
jgi:hypothetical protein